MAAEETDAETTSANAVRTAVVVVHGMGEQRPMDTLDGFVKTALRPRSVDGGQNWDYYYSRPAVITGSYEARRYISRHLGSFTGPDGEPTEPVQGQAEIYEYHWSYLMTGNRFADVMPTTLRLLLRRPSNVPDALYGIWRVVWIVILALLLTIPALFVGGYLLNTDVQGWIIGLITSAVILVFWFGLFRMVARALVNKVTNSFVDVARYLDTSPNSYAARRAIRGGLVDLLHALHDGRYSRIVVVAHSLGAEPDAGAALDDFQDLQFALWQDVRWQGNPWRITDFVTVGTPMALADLLVTRPPLFGGFKKSDRTRRSELLDGLIRRGALVRWPPRSETLPVESDEQRPARYRWSRSGAREVLGSQSPFAVTRWTNLWFPVIRGELRGDWFGGALRPLFGPGIRGIEVLGNKPERFKRGLAHTEYFAHPDKGDEGDAAWHVRRTLALQTHAVLQCLLRAPLPEPGALALKGSTGG